MPVYQDDAGLAGWIEAGRDQRLATEGRQRQSLEQLMHKNRLEEGMTEVPSESVHPTLREGMMPGTAPNSLRVRVTALPSLEKASENIYGRETRVSSAKSLIASMLANAKTAEGPQRNALLAHAANLQSLTEGQGVRDVPQSAIDMANKLLETKMIMGKPGETPVNERTGAPGKTLPLPDMSTFMGASGTAPAGYQPPELGISPGGANISLKPLPPALYAMHQALINDPKTPFGSPAYHEAMAAFSKLIPVTEGGFIASGAGAIRGTPGVPGPSGPTPAGTVSSGPPRAADPTTLKDVTAAGTASTQMTDVLAALQDPKVTGMMGGLLQNPQGAWERMKGEGGIKVPFTGVSVSKSEMPPEFVSFQQKIALHRQLAQKVLEGLRPNQTQIAALSPAMIDANDPPDVATQKAKEWLTYYRQHSDIINQALTQSRRQPISVQPPTTPQQKGGSAASVGVSGTPTNPMDDKVRAWRQSQGR